MTELGDAHSEQQVVALSGHRSPEAVRLYIKRTEAQRIISRQAGGIFGATDATHCAYAAGNRWAMELA